MVTPDPSTVINLTNKLIIKMLCSVRTLHVAKMTRFKPSLSSVYHLFIICLLSGGNSRARGRLWHAPLVHQVQGLVAELICPLIITGQPIWYRRNKFSVHKVQGVVAEFFCPQIMIRQAIWYRRNEMWFFRKLRLHFTRTRTLLGTTCTMILHHFFTRARTCC